MAFRPRSEKFLDKEPDPRDVPTGVVNQIRSNLMLLREQWDRMFPENPVLSQEPDDE